MSVQLNDEMLLFFAEPDIPQWLTIAGSGFFTIVAVIVTYLLARPKASADVAHILAQTNTILATRLKTVTEELNETAQNIPKWTKGLEEAVKRRHALEELVADLEAKLLGGQATIGQLTADVVTAQEFHPLGQATVQKLVGLAESIVENISHIHFMPTSDEPNEADVSSIRRFKEMREASKQIMEMLKDGV